ncbi:hypothetical protein [Streptomyces sp. NPDC053079]|uniref:hypothetical protein n=1 Tax=Streptomyces sp. NPDC053079 TaxID=3365697 RepID=UPI0037CCEE3A
MQRAIEEFVPQLVVPGVPLLVGAAELFGVREGVRCWLIVLVFIQEGSYLYGAERLGESLSRGFVVLGAGSPGRRAALRPVGEICAYLAEVSKLREPLLLKRVARKYLVVKSGLGGQ